MDSETGRGDLKNVGRLQTRDDKETDPSPIQLLEMKAILLAPQLHHNAIIGRGLTNKTKQQEVLL